MISQENINSIVIFEKKIVVSFAYENTDFKATILVTRKDDEIFLEYKNPTKKFLAIPVVDRDELLEIVFDEFEHLNG
jgi:hypothetical protein